MPPELMAELVGFRVKEVGLLSVREGRLFDKYVESQLLKDHPELTPHEARRLKARLAQFRRPLRLKSVRHYESKVLKGIRYPRRSKQRLGKPIQRLAAQYKLSIRTVYRRFRAFLKERKLRRDRRALRLFSRSLSRRRESSGARATSS